MYQAPGATFIAQQQQQPPQQPCNVPQYQQQCSSYMSGPQMCPTDYQMNMQQQQQQQWPQEFYQPAPQPQSQIQYNPTAIPPNHIQKSMKRKAATGNNAEMIVANKQPCYANYQQNPNQMVSDCNNLAVPQQEEYQVIQNGQQPPNHLSPYRYDSSPQSNNAYWRPPSRSEIVRMELRQSLQAKQLAQGQQQQQQQQVLQHQQHVPAHQIQMMPQHQSTMPQHQPQQPQQQYSPEMNAQQQPQQQQNMNMCMNDQPCTSQQAAQMCQPGPSTSLPLISSQSSEFDFSDIIKDDDCETVNSEDLDASYDFNLGCGEFLFDIENESTRVFVIKLLSI